MAKTREIKKRIKAVGNIRRITKTMQMIATSKFARAQQAAVASKPYTETLFDLVSQLASTLGELRHPLLDAGKTKAGGKDLTLVITSDRGLCGPYNGSVLREAMKLIRSNPSVREGAIELVGKKGVNFLKYNGIPISKQHQQMGDKISYDAVRALADDYIARFTSGEVRTVRVVYMRFVSAGKQVPTVMQLLPFKAEAPKSESVSAASAASAKAQADAARKTNLVYEFAPSAFELLDDLLPAAVRSLLFQAFNDAVVSEHVARMVAMKAATDNAGKAGKALTRKFNRARQAQITTELTEIISGAAALG